MKIFVLVILITFFVILGADIVFGMLSDLAHRKKHKKDSEEK